MSMRVWFVVMAKYGPSKNLLIDLCWCLTQWSKTFHLHGGGDAYMWKERRALCGKPTNFWTERPRAIA